MVDCPEEVSNFCDLVSSLFVAAEEFEKGKRDRLSAVPCYMRECGKKRITELMYVSINNTKHV